MDFQGVNAGVVVITGGGSGIGQACALAFCRAGCTNFALLDLNSAGLEDTKAQLEAIASVDVLLVPADVTQEANVVQSIQSILERFGRIDYVVQSAGLNQRPRALLHETEMANYDRVVNINLRGLYMVQREVVRAMREQKSGPHGQKGSIVNIASISGIQPTPNLVPYAASKAGVIALTKGDAQAYIKEGIRINCVCPGVVLTAMNKSSIDAGEDFSIMLSGTPAARAAQPEELAWSVLFLSHPNSSYIVGHSLVQDGGTTLT